MGAILRDTYTDQVLMLDLANLTYDQLQWLHDLKAQAIKGWAKEMLADLKGE